MQALTENKQQFFTEAEIVQLRNAVMKYTGIALDKKQSMMAYYRLFKCIRESQYQEIDTFLSHVSAGNEPELTMFYDAVTTNKSAFLRENYHFDFLQNDILPDLLKSNKNIRIWSAGCSTGEEPYSIGMIIEEQLLAHPLGQVPGIYVTATDLNSSVLKIARSGIYPITAVNHLLPIEILRHWFLKGTDRNEGMVKIKPFPHVKINFTRKNLIQTNKAAQPEFNVIFCRNVCMYFSQAYQEELFQQFYKQLLPDGYLFLGHAESIPNKQLGFKLIENTIYQKI